MPDLRQARSRYSKPKPPPGPFYAGARGDDACFVTVDGAALDPRLDLWKHSPTGFEWGYGGSGPAQLALAILAHALQDDDLAVKLHQHFKAAYVAHFPSGCWSMTRDEVWICALACCPDDLAKQLAGAIEKAKVMEELMKFDLGNVEPKRRKR